MPCSKQFSITVTEDDPCVVDCDSAPTDLASLVWDIIETNDPVDGAYGTAVLSAAGASGSFSITGATTNVQGGEGTASGSFSTRFCNNTSIDRTIQITFTTDWSISVTAAIGVGGNCGIAILKDQLPFPEIFFQYSVELAVFDSGTETESNTGEVTIYSVVCPACSVTEFTIGIQGGGNAGGPISDPASLSYSLVGEFSVTLV